MSMIERACSRRQLLRRSALLAGGIGLAGELPGLSTAFAAGEKAAPIPVGKPPSALATANLDFGFRLFGQLAKTSGTTNILISPLSISLALAMTYNGARGATQQAMSRALGLQGISLQDLNSGSAALLAGLSSLDPAVELHVANSLWSRTGAPVVPAFAAALTKYYGAEIASLDFASPSAPAAINGWVSKKTQGLIPSIVKTIAPTTLLYLIDALYFKGTWSTPFDPRHTAPHPFTLQGGAQKTLPMMSRTGVFQHVLGANYEAIRLPYGAGKLSMTIVLPAKSSSLAAMQSGLTGKTWQSWLGSLANAQGTLLLPRFSVNYSQGLKAALGALGMGVAFDPNAGDLGGIVQLPHTFIDEVRHATVLQVYEAGTRAAAVTSVGVGATAVMASEFTMVVDRPFLCAIHDETTGTLLFLGSILAPQ